jgi:flagellar hook-basal body complex protein FliE
MPSTVDLANEVHSGLMREIAPVTPGTIRASSLGPNRNPEMFFISCCAVLSVLFFIWPVIFPPLTSDGRPDTDLRNVWQIFGGAGMGSSFYALYTASGYINSNTFDRKYRATYLIRFFLGILAGVILAYFLDKNLIKFAGGSGDNVNVGVATLALIGGFASDAVARILFRISETLVTLVAGSDKEKVDAAKQKATADAEKKAAQVLAEQQKKVAEDQKKAADALAEAKKQKAQKLNEIVKDLQTSAGGAPAGTHDEIHAAIQKLQNLNGKP